MNDETMETRAQTWEDDHPWISLMACSADDDTLDEVICYTLDELRFE